MRRFRSFDGVIPGGRHHALRLASNVASAIDRRMPEARALAEWLDRDRGPLGLRDGADFNDGGSRKTALAAASWRRVRATIARELRAAPMVADSPLEQWIRLLAGRIGLGTLDTHI